MNRFKIVHPSGVTMLLALIVGVGAKPRTASAQESMIVVDGSGLNVGALDIKSGITPVPNQSTVAIGVFTFKLSPMEMSILAPPPADTLSVVKVIVPSSAMVGFCVYSKYYDKRTGRCGDGSAPYKIVPIGALSNPASQIPNIRCTDPRVATFSTATGKFSCLVPPGFKLSM